MTRSRYLSRCLGAALLALLLGACAAPRKSIGLEGPPRPEIGSDVDPAEQLKNLTFEELLSRAAAHTQQGNFELAALHYERALQRQPDSVITSYSIHYTKLYEGVSSASSKRPASGRSSPRSSPSPASICRRTCSAPIASDLNGGPYGYP